MADALSEAGIDHVLLDESELTARDSDVDIIVSPEAIGAVDLVIRSGRLGRLLQRLDYDIPSARYYVLESQEEDRRYRQLDVASDASGLGRYGPAVKIAQSNKDDDRGPRNEPAPGVKALYLAVKRARKHAPLDIRLRTAFDADPAAARALLSRTLGDEGRQLADALDSRVSDISAELNALNKRIAALQRSPQALAQRGWFSACRVVRRTLRPTGLVVCIVGPDGTGKSTLAQGLVDASPGLFRRAVRLHLGPGLLPAPSKLLGRKPSDPEFPHARPPSGIIGSAARTTYLYLDALIGWWPKVGAPRVRSSLVIIERGWHDLVVDPRRYRLVTSRQLLRVLERLLPRPDVILVLDAPAVVVAARKPELAVEEIERQLNEWRSLTQRASSRAHLLDATLAPEQLLEHALALLHDQLERRQPSTARAELALKAAGKPSLSRPNLSLISVNGVPRWLVPRELGARGPYRAGLYRPARARQMPGVLAMEALAAFGHAGMPVSLELERGLLPRLMEILNCRVARFGGLGISRDRKGRASLTIFNGSELVAFAKLSALPDPLHHEFRILETISRAEPQAFSVPRPISLFPWSDLTVLVLEAVKSRGFALRSFGRSEYAVVEEIARLGETLEPVLGSGEGLVPAHGDFAPWNSALDRGMSTVWDWEDARLGLPLEDFFHWHAQLLTLFGVGSPETLVAHATSPNPELVGVMKRLGLGGDAPARALRTYLERRAASDGRTAADKTLSRALGLLLKERGE